jgi:hypothetical protein
MSKRIHVVLADEDYRAHAVAARKRGKSMAQLVRESLSHALAEDAEAEVKQRIAAIVRFSRHSGPVADIDEHLAQIEIGRGPLQHQ